MAKIEAGCATKWAPSFEKQLVCRKTQGEAALVTMKAFMAADANTCPRGRAWRAVFQGCAAKSPYDFEQINSCIDAVTK
jgi:hypothetical protein